ncbi:nucleotide-binding protein [Methanolacinia petrolearia]|uniref:nucleotide-binding protein n=1 Tax=Methanolacinia petrolearia TaxID=54120 RepID=UPI003BA8DB51
MKIKGTWVRISFVNLIVAAILIFLLALYFAASGDYFVLIWGIVSIIILILIPIGLNYMSQSQYAGLEPIYEAEAKNTKIKMINPSSIGNVVRIEGVVERALFKFLNRPQYDVADRTGEISVKMFTSPKEDVDTEDYVEVYGQIIRRYVLVGDPVINAVIIRKTDRKKKQE